MTTEQIAAVVARQLAAESGYLGAVARNPRIRAEHRQILEEAERDLAQAVRLVLESSAAAAGAEASGTPDGMAGLPDAGGVQAPANASGVA